MTSRLPQMDLKQFMLRMRVLGLYRDITRTLKSVSDPSERQFIREWARSDFERARLETDSEHIKYLLSTGKASYHHLQSNLQMSAQAPVKAGTTRAKHHNA
ncbi:LYR motif-containing protein 2 [Podochytrium sp. JEL0797]|nr:LYR motif-containing protein 2 [Podochytrium sp. JEL0797]